MAKTLSLVLNGEVPLDLFAESIQHFRQLIDALTDEVSGEAHVSWVVDEVASGNAVATIRGDADHHEDVDRVVRAYAALGRALERQEVVPYSPRVVDAARRLTSVLNGKITSIRFETEDDAATVTADAVDQPRTTTAAHGLVKGRVESLRSRHRLSFTLANSLANQTVYCVLRPDQVDLVRNAWGRRVIVEGWVKRDPETGRALEVDPIEKITILPDVVPGSYRRARGIAPAPADAPSTEDVIRRLRDA